MIVSSDLGLSGGTDILADKSTRTATHPPRRMECQSWIVQPRLGPSAKFMRDACRQRKGTNSTVRPIQRTTTLGPNRSSRLADSFAKGLPSPSALQAGKVDDRWL